MTKQQKICAGIGGAYGLCVLVLAWFLYSAYAEHQEILEGGESTPVGLVTAKANFVNSYTQEKPFPSSDSVKRVKANEKAYVEWRESNFREVSKGDCPSPPLGLEGSVLYDMMRDQRDAMRLFPGGASNGHICSDKFQFGFEEYLGEEGDDTKKAPMPPKNSRQLSELYKQFVMITNMVDVLHASGGSVEIRKIERPKKLQGEEDSAGNQANQRKKGGNKAKSAKSAVAEEGPKRYDFNLEFAVRPSAFVNVLNAFATSPRFFVVEDLNFEHEGESLKDRLNRVADPSKSKEDQQTGGRRPRHRRQEMQEKKVEFDGDLVTRPDLEKPILVTMKLSVYDFGTGTSRKEDK